MLVMVLVVSIEAVPGVMAVHVGRSVRAMSSILFFFERGSILSIGMHIAEGAKHMSGDNLIIMIIICGSVVQSIAGPYWRCSIIDVLYMHSV